MPEQHQSEIGRHNRSEHGTEHGILGHDEPARSNPEEDDLDGNPRQTRQRESRLRRNEQAPDDRGDGRSDNRERDVYLKPDVRERGEQAQLEREPEREIRAPHASEYAERSGMPWRRRMRLSASSSCFASPMSYHSPGIRYAYTGARVCNHATKLPGASGGLSSRR